MLQLSQNQKLSQKLTPQQIQYLQLLQVPILALEQRIKTELEINPLLEEGMDGETEIVQQEEATTSEDFSADAAENTNEQKDEFTFEDYVNDESDYSYKGEVFDNEEKDELPIAASEPLTQKLFNQLSLTELTEKDILVAKEIIGNLDEDGYLRRELQSIVDDINLEHQLGITIEQAENVVKKIQRLEPLGIASRTLQECLLVQLEFVQCDESVRTLAATVLEKYFDEFTKKHYEQLSKLLNVDLEEIKKVIDLISHFNPKPGETDETAQPQYITPDFIVHKDDDELIIQLYDRNIPPLRINKGYKELVTTKKNKIDTATKTFLKQKFDAAKWFIACIHQRRETMMKVMRTIVEKQKSFFETGENLKPMVYKDIAEVIQMDISTISRTVNGKYVQTDFGMYELRYFFSEGIQTESGEEVSNKEIKERLKTIIENEDGKKPLSDDRLTEILNQQGFHIARRTVAKYREAMMIPVARLRRKI